MNFAFTRTRPGHFIFHHISIFWIGSFCFRAGPDYMAMRLFRMEISDKSVTEREETGNTRPAVGIAPAKKDRVCPCPACEWVEKDRRGCPDGMRTKLRENAPPHSDGVGV